ncbi:MAG: radical SAM family heme chaperone HemW [Alphaproteobacteria bacterium]
MQSHQNTPFGLYIHWPYCLSKCPYCNFFSHAAVPLDEAVLYGGYARDLAQAATLIGTRRCLTSIYFGGGTPSLMSVKLMEQLLATARRYFDMAQDIHITLEANPDAITADKMAEVASLGVNRLSLGVQSLSDTGLKFLGRRHTAATALQRLEEAMRIFPHVNMDLIYARPDQTLRSWRSELKQALSIGLRHYSLYQLTIEPETAFFKRGISVQNDETARAFYELTDDLMQKASVPAYEVSNYAASGEESRHNLIYWRGQDYIGIGPAAHGRIGLVATENPAHIGTWLSSGGQQTTLTPTERQTERILMGLRLRHHPFPEQELNPKGIEQALQQKWIIRTPAGIIPTREGTLMLDTLILMLLPD